jgi:hypothetical protein
MVGLKRFFNIGPKFKVGDVLIIDHEREEWERITTGIKIVNVGKKKYLHKDVYFNNDGSIKEERYLDDSNFRYIELLYKKYER